MYCRPYKAWEISRGLHSCAGKYDMYAVIAGKCRVSNDVFVRFHSFADRCINVAMLAWLKSGKYRKIKRSTSLCRRYRSCPCGGGPGSLGNTRLISRCTSRGPCFRRTLYCRRVVASVGTTSDGRRGVVVVVVIVVEVVVEVVTLDRNTLKIASRCHALARFGSANAIDDRPDGNADDGRVHLL